MFNTPPSKNSGASVLVWSLAPGQMDPVLTTPMAAPLTRVLAAAHGGGFYLGDQDGAVHAVTLLVPPATAAAASEP